MEHDVKNIKEQKVRVRNIVAAGLGLSDVNKLKLG